jgi:hypothetical protein
MASIKVTWTCSRVIEVPFQFGVLKKDFLEQVNSIASNAIDDDADNWDWKWEEQPSEDGFIEEVYSVEPEHWFECAGLTIATNGHLIVTPDSPAECRVSVTPWVKVENPSMIGTLEKMLSVDVSNLPLHRGYFFKSFKCFQNYRIVGNTPEGYSNFGCGGYALDGSKLIAVIMPTIPRKLPDGETYPDLIQFNP